MSDCEKVITLLKTAGRTLSLAESVTGGYVSYLLTKTPGSSSVFKFGAVVYSLGSKNKLLSLPVKLLEPVQGVSAVIAGEMAKKIRVYANTYLGASVVGFAGPRAFREKTGTVFFGFSSPGKLKVEKQIFAGSRDRIRKQAANYLIKLILNNIKNNR